MKKELIYLLTEYLLTHSDTTEGEIDTYNNWIRTVNQPDIEYYDAVWCVKYIREMRKITNMEAIKKAQVIDAKNLNRGEMCKYEGKKVL